MDYRYLRLKLVIMQILTRNFWLVDLITHIMRCLVKFSARSPERWCFVKGALTENCASGVNLIACSPMLTKDTAGSSTNVIKERSDFTVYNVTTNILAKNYTDFFDKNISMVSRRFLQ